MLTSRQLQGLNITVINTELAQCDNNWNYSSVNSPFSRLYLIIEGSGEVVHSGRKFNLEAGNLFLVPAFTESSYRCSEYLMQYYIHFTHQCQSGCGIFEGLDIEYLLGAQRTDYYLFKRLLDLNPGKALIERDPSKYHKNFQMKRSFEMADEMNPSQYLESIGILQQLIARFIETASQESQNNNLLTRYNLREILTYINRNLEKQITIKQLSEMMFVSNDHFSRVFSKITGIRPMDYITRKRIERSQMLLLSTESGLDEIAVKCGFSSTSHLSRHFKKHISTSPGRYRKIHS